jgi:dynein heavy chain
LKDETTLMQNKKQQLEEDMSLTEARLERAKKLISLTGDEAKRWEETCLTLNE